MSVFCSFFLNSFTKLNEIDCINILELVENEFGEIVDFIIEDDEVMFSVYPAFLENVPPIISNNHISLQLIEISNYSNSIGYKICIN
jgi:hypothetical protein